jgi:hypothetical protein
MAKSKSSTGAAKISFGKRKGGKPRKTKGPKDKNRKPYIGQGGL